MSDRTKQKEIISNLYIKTRSNSKSGVLVEMVLYGEKDEFEFGFMLSWNKIIRYGIK